MIYVYYVIDVANNRKIINVITLIYFNIYISEQIYSLYILSIISFLQHNSEIE